MAYKNLTEVTSTPLPESIYIVTPVPKTNDNDNQDDSKRGKVKFVTLTPGFVVTTNLQQVDNEIQTLSSQHVQKVTKAPANIPDNFLSTVVSTSKSVSVRLPSFCNFCRLYDEESRQ